MERTVSAHTGTQDLKTANRGSPEKAELKKNTNA
jgi:hypothetical protein